MSYRDALTPNGRVTRRARWILTSVTIVILSAAWSFRPAFLPSLAAIAGAYPALLDQGLGAEVAVSITTNLQAIAITCALVVPLAYLTVLPAVRPFVGLLAKARFLGLTGLVVLFTLIFGGGHALKVSLLVFGLGVFLITSLYDIVEAIPREEFDHARTLRLGRWGSVVEVVVRGHLHEVIDAVRQNAAMGWVMLTMVEGLVRFEGGLGVMMLSEDRRFAYGEVFALALLVAAIGALQDVVFVGIKKLACPYASLTLERQ